jgi:hypothetical protein
MAMSVLKGREVGAVVAEVSSGGGGNGGGGGGNGGGGGGVFSRTCVCGGSFPVG